MRELLCVGLGGALGAIARYLATGVAHRLLGLRFPWGTLAVNVVGCLGIGIVMSLLTDRKLLRPELQLFLVTGILGGLTTFSTFGYETVALIRDGELRLALWNISVSLALGLAAVWLGRELVRP